MATFFLCDGLTTAKDTFPVGGAETQQEALLEIKWRRRAVLLIIRSPVVDVSGANGSIVAEALKASPANARRYPYPYRVMVRRLNEYIRKYRSMSAVEEIERADYIICFNLLEYRRVLNSMYPYGELFVILNQGPEHWDSLRIVWKTKKVMFAEDAVREFLKDLKRVRGEK